MARLINRGAYIIGYVYDLPCEIDGAKVRETFDKFIDHPNGAIFRTLFVFKSASNRSFYCVLICTKIANRLGGTCVLLLATRQ